MSAGIRLIAGLGNPGPAYENTRHNAGAWFVTGIASQAEVSLRETSRFKGQHAILRCESSEHELHLLIPSTFMNLSGQSVAALARYYDIPPKSILVAHDDIDLEAGDIRLKLDGGHGGHNGLRDIISHLGSAAFHRLRIGVAHPGHRNEVADHVLSAPSRTDRALIDKAMENAEAVLPALLAGKFQQATQTLHTRDK